MKSVLFLINNLGSGGAQRQMVELSIGLKDRGYNVRFLIYSKKWSEYYYQYIIDNGIEIDGIYEQNYLKRILKIRRYIRSNKFDVVIAFLEVAAFIAELSGFPKKKWRLIVGERSADPAKRTSFKLRTFLKFHRLADYVVTNSHANIDLIKEIVPKLPTHKLKVIYNISDNKKLQPDTHFTFLSHEDKKLHLIVASSHRYLKNLNGLIEGVHLMKANDCSKLKILWFGSNKFDTSLDDGRKKIEIFGLQDVFYFHDETLEIYDYMNKADAVGLFSFFEGLPNALCEGMTLGKPIVATKVSDVPLLIENNVNGFLCDPKSPESIAQALTALVCCSADKLSTMGKANVAKANELFNRTKILDSYENLF